MKKTLAILVLVVGVLFSANAQKIGYMNYQKVINSHPSYDTAKAQLAMFQQELASKLDQQEKEFQSKYQIYQQLASSPGIDSMTLEAKKNVLISLNQDLEMSKQNANSAYEKMQAALVQKIIDKINVVVEAIAKDNGMAYVLDNSSGVLVVKDPKGDLTKKVMDKMGLKENLGVE